MSNAIYAPYLYDDEVAFVSASSTSTVTEGDWVMFSALWGIASQDATIGSPAYKVSGLGIALERNPKYDDQGVAYNNSALAVATRGTFRVSGSVSGTAYTVPAGSFVYPDTSGSGIVGQTGKTGVGALWNTAPPQKISANPTGAIASGVAQVLTQDVGGDATALQMVIRLNMGTNVGYF